MIVFGAGAVGLIVFLIVWLALGHFWLGVLAGIVIWAVLGGGGPRIVRRW